MGRQHVKDGFIRVARQKTGTVLEIPIIQELREILAAHPADHLTFLTTRAGEPFTGVASQIGFETGALKLAGLGGSASQIAAISGHATLHEVERYTKEADQKRLATAAMEAVQKDKGRTISGEPNRGLAKRKPKSS